jgi:hypothetical protein
VRVARADGESAPRACRTVGAALTWLCLCAPAAAEAQTADSASLGGGVYLDVAYLLSDNHPENHQWRTKGTTPIVDRLEINNATLWAGKRSTSDSRWGFQFGVQAGEDVDNLESSEAAESADFLKHLYYTNVTFLAPVGGRELLLTGGLIPGHIGYESFQAIDNPTYTRVYGVDYVPYFEWGVSAEYPVDASLRGKLLIVNGWDYLASPNSLPSYGMQLQWDVDDESWLRGNVFYGPEQEATSLEFWRFAGEAMGQWRMEDFLLIGNLGWGTEEQASLEGNPRYDWTWGALWVTWQPDGRPWSAGLRPEFFRDESGLQSGARQTIGALTATLQYRLETVRLNVWSVRAEYRLDRSTGPDAGFYRGPGNELASEQQLFIIAVNWQFGFHKPRGREL